MESALLVAIALCLILFAYGVFTNTPSFKILGAVLAGILAIAFATGK